MYSPKLLIMNRLRILTPISWRKYGSSWLVLGLFLVSFGVVRLQGIRESGIQVREEVRSAKYEVRSIEKLKLSGGETLLPISSSPGTQNDDLSFSQPSTEPSVSSSQEMPLQHRVHVIRPGESSWSIARQYNINMATLREANRLPRKQLLIPGQTLLIPPGRGMFYRVHEGDSLWEICHRYGVDLQAVLTQNNVSQASLVLPGQQIFLPGASAKQAVTDLIWPVQGRLSSRFGPRQHPMGGGAKIHHGLDIAAPSGRIVRAAQAGTVIFVGRRGQLGRAVILQHADDYQTVYGHNSKILVNFGQTVEQGQSIARVGSTGKSTGPHLHFELHKAGRAINPLSYLP